MKPPNISHSFLSIYNALWFIASPIINAISSHLSSAPGKSKKAHLKARLGAGVDQLPTFAPKGIWIHALSAGEVLSALPLARTLIAIRHNIASSKPIVMSTSTASGYKILKSSGLGLDGVFIAPLDAPWLMKNLVNRLDPSIFILIEGDVWPNLLFSLKERKAKCFLVNARMSPSSFRRYRMLAKFGGNVFSMFDAVFVASPEMIEFYSEFLPPLKLFFFGNIKWDAVREKKISDDKLSELRKEIGVDPSRPIWIAGSVHRGEEDVILKTHRKIIEHVPGTVLILAPRKIPDDVEWFVNACQKYGFQLSRRSAREKITDSTTVYLVDTLGELMNFYGIAHVAFVGGSFVPKGGHNLLEPAIYGIPVYWGPYVFNFKDIAAFIESTSKGAEVSNQKALEDFLLRHLISFPDFAVKDGAIWQDSENISWNDSPTLDVLSTIFSIASNL